VGVEVELIVDREGLHGQAPGADDIAESFAF
jgi:hypothetical protein